MHSTTIVQNKIINIICSCPFFIWLVFIGQGLDFRRILTCETESSTAHEFVVC